MSYNVIADGVVHSNHPTKKLAKAEIKRVRREDTPWHDEDACKYANSLKVEEVVDKVDEVAVGKCPVTQPLQPMPTSPKCPITLPHIFQAEFAPMTEADLEGFAGVEGDGYIAEIGEYIVVLDHSQDTAMLQVHGPDGSWWSLEFPTKFSAC